jgi:signal transduction histidine kinase
MDASSEKTAATPARPAPLDAAAARGQEPSSLLLLRLAGLLAWAIVALENGLRLAAPPPGMSAGSVLFKQATVVGLLALFGLAFAWNTRRIQGLRPSAASVLLLVLQVGLALTVTTDLLWLVAVEAPLVLRGRALATWIGLQLGATAAVAVALAAAGSLALPPNPAGLAPRALQALLIAETLVWQVLAFAGGHLAASRHRHSVELARLHADQARANAELRALQRLLEEGARLGERVRISRELHDALGHHLAALSLTLELAAHRAGEAAAGPVRDAQAVAKQMLTDVRSTVASLRSERPGEADLAGALQVLIEGVRRLEIRLTLPEGLGTVDGASAHVLFRCVQEAITNTLRHGRARRLWVELSRAPGRLELRVRDDGEGAATIEPGLGLTGMRERFEEAGGGLALETAPGEGFRLSGWLPERRAA